ncbi:MAG: cell surface protein [Alphaproteobacteria bacterium]|nr:cell surface protein [Alphaproteobacteria bacterium]
MLLLLLACTAKGPVDDTAPADTAPAGPDPFADALIAFTPGDNAGYGQERMPDVVLGSPEAPGGGAGSLDVVSLGREGEIVLAFTDIGLVDGPGPDLLVFENPFPGFYETGEVAVSEDGETWSAWPCAADDPDGGYPGCAGVGVVYANSENGVDATDPEAAGGDAFDLAELGLTRARFVRVRDSGQNSYDGTSGGFDLDALAVINGEALE